MIKSQRSKLLNLIKTYAVGFLLILFYIYILYNNKGSNFSYPTVLLFLLIAVISLTKIIISVSKKPYTITLLHWFFIFSFLGVAGFTQYINNKFVYGLILSEQRIQQILVIVIIWIISYDIGLKRIRNFNKDYGMVSRILTIRLKDSKRFITFSTIVSVVVLLYVLSKGGLTSTFSRYTGSEAFKKNSVAETLIFSSFLRNLVIYGFAISIVHLKRHKKGLSLVIVQAICLLIVNSPIGMARYSVSIIYLGLAIIIFPALKKGKKFIIIFFSAFIIIFPMINVFRYTTLSDVSFNLLTQTMEDVSKNFLHGDYDAFSMIANTYDYIKVNGIAFGYQLIGVLLFFIPRSIWPSKPVGSGYIVRESQGKEFRNVSSSLIAEGLINFGVTGVILFGFFFGKICSYLDRLYWKNESTSISEYTYLDIIYPFSLSMFFFMSRGDLLSTFSFSVSHVMVYTLLFWVNNKLLFSEIKDRPNY